MAEEDFHNLQENTSEEIGKAAQIEYLKDQEKLHIHNTWRDKKRYWRQLVDYILIFSVVSLLEYCSIVREARL